MTSTLTGVIGTQAPVAGSLFDSGIIDMQPSFAAMQPDSCRIGFEETLCETLIMG